MFSSASILVCLCLTQFVLGDDISTDKEIECLLPDQRRGICKPYEECPEKNTYSATCPGQEDIVVCCESTASESETHGSERRGYNRNSTVEDGASDEEISDKFFFTSWQFRDWRNRRSNGRPTENNVNYSNNYGKHFNDGKRGVGDNNRYENKENWGWLQGGNAFHFDVEAVPGLELHPDQREHSAFIDNTPSNNRPYYSEENKDQKNEEYPWATSRRPTQRPHIQEEHNIRTTKQSYHPWDTQRETTQKPYYPWESNRRPTQRPHIQEEYNTRTTEQSYYLWDTQRETTRKPYYPWESNRRPTQRPHIQEEYNRRTTEQSYYPWDTQRETTRKPYYPWESNRRPTQRPHIQEEYNRRTTEQSYYPWDTQRETTRKPYYPWESNVTGGARKSISEIMCEEYSKSVTDIITGLPLVPNPSPIEIKVGKCKFVQQLIVGGEHTIIGEFPHMAAIGYFNRSSRKVEWLCGGSLISEQYVLTAAHCTHTMFGYPVKVRLGEYNLRKKNDGANPQDYQVVEVIKHPDHSGPRKYNDIALLKLSRKVNITKNIRPACLQTKTAIPESKVTAVGWGRLGRGENMSDVLQKVTLNVIDKERCRKSYGNKVFQATLPQGIIDSQICAGELAGGKDTCQGDSGGPLEYVSQSNRCVHYIIGVTSFGKACGLENSMGVYTRISSYVPWIESVVWPQQ